MEKPRYRPPAGIPSPEGERRRFPLAISIGIHVLIVVLLLVPFAASVVVDAVAAGSGGPGPAGGGGGGGGSLRDRITERIRYMVIGPEVVIDEDPEPLPPSRLDEPEETQPTPAPEEPAPAETPPAAQPQSAQDSGSGDGSEGGRGPGTGGGVGTGIGAGRGSAVGAGVGGGEGAVYPPTAVEAFIPPFPIPQRVRPHTLVAVFEVDERGNARLLGFNETSDRDYNRRLRETLTRMRWRPATLPDGTPVVDTTTFGYVF